MVRPFKVACVQNCAEREMAPSIAALEPLVRGAVGAGADLIVLPEMAAMFEPDNARLLAKAQPEASDPGVAACRRWAAESKRWILVGSLYLREPGAARVVNRSLLIDSAGGIVARYDKIHLFDVDLDGGESYRESANYQPGESAVISDLPWGRIGLTICYDLRFPALYRALAESGASFLTIPSAFTRKTGEAHWHVLVRARAIETGCFVFAAAQAGLHENKRETYGHSLIVAPWGEILAEGGVEPGVFLAKIDPAKVETARKTVPSLQHGRRFSMADPKAGPEHLHLVRGSA